MLTPRDRCIACWIASIGAASAEHVMRRFGLGRSQAHLRLAMLADAGLLERRMLLYQRPALYVATRQGLRWTGLSRLGVFRVSVAGFEHAWQVASVAAELHGLLPGWEVLGEREVRDIERAEDGLLGSCRVGELGGEPRLHRPDLALRGAGRLVMVEVELSLKASRRLLAICTGWARARHVAHIYYLTAPEVASAVVRAVGRARAQDRITVLPLGRPDLLAGIEKRNMEVSDARDTSDTR